MSLESKYSVLEVILQEVIEYRKNEEYSKALLELTLILKDNPLDDMKLDDFISRFRDTYGHMPNVPFIVAGLTSLTMEFE